MKLNDVRFTRQNGGLARPLAGEDHISGLLFFSDDKPAGFASSNYLQILDPNDAIEKGIVNDRSDETKASGGNVLITTPGAAGTISTITMNGVVLGSYTVVTGNVNDDVATGLRAAINALTGTHGYIAAGTTANVLLTPPAGLGDSINGGALLGFANTGTGAATATQFSGGVDAFFDVVYYHIEEFFRINPGATLWVGFGDVPSQDYDFLEVDELQIASQGKLRRMGVYMGAEGFDVDHLAVLKARRDALSALHMPVAIAYAADITGMTLSAIDDLRAFTYEGVYGVCIGQDGENVGAALYAEKGYSITCLGAMMGVSSLAKVHENIGWVGKFNMAQVELQVPALATGDLIRDLSENLLDALHTKGYIFLRKYVGDAGTYFNDDHSCDLVTSDYAFISNSITMDKAVRGVYTKLLPQLNGPVYVEASTGLLSPDTITYLEQLAQQHLDQMNADGELSGATATINPNQDIQSTGILNITIGLVGVAASRNIAVKIGYVKSI